MTATNQPETVKDCNYPWTWMMLTSDGRVLPCCYAKRELGNLNEASAEAIWNGPVAVELRAFIKRNEVHPVCAGAVCKYVQNMSKPGAVGVRLHHDSTQSGMKEKGR